MVDTMRVVVALVQMRCLHSAFRARIGLRQRVPGFLARCHTLRLWQSGRGWSSRERRQWGARARTVFAAG